MMTKGVTHNEVQIRIYNLLNPTFRTMINQRHDKTTTSSQGDGPTLLRLSNCNPSQYEKANNALFNDWPAKMGRLSSDRAWAKNALLRRIGNTTLIKRQKPFGRPFKPVKRKKSHAGETTQSGMRCLGIGQREDQEAP